MGAGTVGTGVVSGNRTCGIPMEGLTENTEGANGGRGKAYAILREDVTTIRRRELRGTTSEIRERLRADWMRQEQNSAGEIFNDS
jgi:hypothetical protein